MNRPNLSLRGNAVDSYTHVVVSAYVEVHAEVMAYVPTSVPDFLAYWQELPEAFSMMAQDPDGMGARLVSQYPIAYAMQAFMHPLGDAYEGIAAAASGVREGYVNANAHDVMRNVEGRINEQWANVSDGSPETGYAHQQVQRLRHAHAALFGYEPEDPVDLENFFSAFPAAFMTMSEHVEMGRLWCAEFFPGATDIPDAFYVNLGNTYIGAASAAVHVLEGYQAVAEADLGRHKAPRVEEAKADVAS